MLMADTPGRRRTIIERAARIADSRQHPAISTAGLCTKRKRKKMTDLDRKIAELKGWSIVTATEFGVMTGRDIIGSADVIIKDCAPNAICLGDECGIGGWSTSDAKAFELVDEMESQFPPYHFQLARLPDPNGWRGKFTMDVGDKMMAPRKYTGQGNTRAEAICRAYIALKEWEGKT